MNIINKIGVVALFFVLIGLHLIGPPVGLGNWIGFSFMALAGMILTVFPDIRQ